MQITGSSGSATIWRLWKLQVEVRGRDGRGLTATHGNPDVPRTHMQIILGSYGGF